MRSIDKVGIIACGTAFHAGMVGKYIIEDLARIPVEVEVASSSATAGPSSNRGSCLSSSASRARRRTRWLRCASETRRQGCRHRERGGQHHRARSGRGAVYARWAGDSGGVHQAYNTQLMAIYMIALELARLSGDGHGATRNWLKAFAYRR